MLACIRAEPVDAVWVIEQSRLTRGDELEVALLTRELRERGVRVIAGATEIDLQDPAGSLVFGLHSVVDRHEAARFKERVARGKREKALQGRRPSGPAPYGYRNPPKDDPRRGILQPHPEEAAVIGRIYASLAAGTSLGSLAAQLTAEGVPSRRAGTWTKTTLRRMVANPVYYGVTETAVWERDGNAYRKNADNPRAIVAPDTHEALVDRRLWETANRMRRGPSTCRPGLLTGLLYIGGHRQTIDYTNGRPHYQLKIEGCPWVSVPILNAAVWEGFVGIARRPVALTALLRKAAGGEGAEAAAGERVNMEALARKLRARLSGLITMRADGEIDRATFESRTAEAQGQLLRIEQQLAAGRRQSEALGNHQAHAVAAMAALLGRKLSQDQQRRVLRSLVGRVDVEVTESAPQERGAHRGRWAERAAPKWLPREIALHLHRDPAPETICSPWRRRPR